MRTLSGIEASVGNDEALDGATGYEVFADDLGHVGDGDIAVPDGLGIHDHGGTVLALIEASGFIGADGAGEAGALHRVLEGSVELAFAVGGAGGACAAGFTKVCADKDVAVEFRQSGTPSFAQCFFYFT